LKKNIFHRQIQAIINQYYEMIEKILSKRWSLLIMKNGFSSVEKILWVFSHFSYLKSQRYNVFQAKRIGQKFEGFLSLLALFSTQKNRLNFFHGFGFSKEILVKIKMETIFFC